MRHFSFRVSLSAEHTQTSFQAICAVVAQRRLLSSRSFSHNKHRSRQNLENPGVMFSASDGCDIEKGNTHAKARPL
jgi:hypothetical protein